MIPAFSHSAGYFECARAVLLELYNVSYGSPWESCVKSESDSVSLRRDLRVCISDKLSRALLVSIGSVVCGLQFE